MSRADRRQSISPHALAFDKCPRCTWLKYRGVGKPYDGPATYRRLDLAHKHVLAPGTSLAPWGIPGTVMPAKEERGTKVCSRNIGRNGWEVRVFGYADLLALHDDGESLIVVDNKSTTVTDPEEEERAARKYRDQLGSYCYGFQYPERGKPAKVFGAYLLAFDIVPDITTALETTIFVQQKGLAIRVPYDEHAIREALDVQVALIVDAVPPPPSQNCGLCEYIRQYRAFFKTDKPLIEATKDELQPPHEPTDPKGIEEFLSPDPVEAHA